MSLYSENGIIPHTLVTRRRAPVHGWEGSGKRQRRQERLFSTMGVKVDGGGQGDRKERTCGLRNISREVECKIHVTLCTIGKGSQRVLCCEMQWCEICSRKAALAGAPKQFITTCTVCVLWNTQTMVILTNHLEIKEILINERHTWIHQIGHVLKDTATFRATLFFVLIYDEHIVPCRVPCRNFIILNTLHVTSYLRLNFSKTVC